jgi:hypothetical protein
MAQTGVQFDKSSYNYGKIKQGVHKSFEFNFHTAQALWEHPSVEDQLLH